MSTLHKVNFKIHYRGETSWDYKVSRPLEPRDVARDLLDSWEDSGWSLKALSFIEVEGHFFILEHGKLVEVFDVPDVEVSLE